MTLPASRPKIRTASQPDAADMARCIDIVRTPTNKALSFWCLSHEPYGCYTHWWRGATNPCLEENCEACAANCPMRWKGYMAAFMADSGEVAIFEYPQSPAAVVVEWFRTHGTLRGAAVSARRTGSRDNDRVRLLIRAGSKEEIQLPPAPSIPDFLARLWDLDGSHAVDMATSGNTAEQAFREVQAKMRDRTSQLNPINSHHTQGATNGSI